MSTFYVAGREVHPRGSKGFQNGWIEGREGAPTQYLYFGGGGKSGFAVAIKKPSGWWFGYAMHDESPAKVFDTAGEAMNYVEALVALQD